MANEPGAAAEAETVVEALAALRGKGYTADFSVAPGGKLRCGECGTLHDPAEAHVDEALRFEGESNPGDESVVFALTCGACGTKGTMVTAYGASVSADEATVVTALTTR